MIEQNENPGVEATTTGAEFEAANFTLKEYRERAAAATALCEAIRDCHPQDAAQLCAAFLTGMQTNGPQYDVFGRLREDARWWADIAPPHELAAYSVSALDRLRRLALALETRKRLLWHLWSSLSSADRKAFLIRVREGR